MKTKQFFASLLMLCSTGLYSYAQTADIPTIIVFPENRWMLQYGFASEIDDDGKSKVLPDYDKAFNNNAEIADAITAVQDVFEERGFKHKDLQNLLKGMDKERAVQMASRKKAEVGLMEELLQQANPDIRVDLDFTVKSIGPRKSVDFKLKAVDAYNYEQVASCQGLSEPSMEPLSLALRKIVAGKSEEFCEKMKKHFIDLRENGRKITIIFRAAEGVDIDFMNDEVGSTGDVYSDYLLDWLQAHAVNKAATAGRQTEVMCEFESVRIPFFDDRNRPNNATRWARAMIKQFSADTGLKAKVATGGGMGLVNIIVGEE
jgi:hypothetical protein